MLGVRCKKIQGGHVQKSGDEPYTWVAHAVVRVVDVSTESMWVSLICGAFHLPSLVHVGYFGHE